MVCSKSYASFTNTRQRPRKPTKEEDTMCYQLPVQAAVGTVDTGHVDFDDSDPVNNGELTLNGNMILTESNPDRTFLTLRNYHSADTIRYGFEDRADLITTGMPLKAGDAVDIDGPQMIYVKSNSDELVETCKHWGIG